MVFKRKIYSELLQWKENKGATALLITGARRVGKTTVVQEFAKNEYKSHVYLNFTSTPQSILDLFRDRIYDLNTFFQMLSVQLDIPLYERNTLFIFDEVQNFPLARQAIKHLVADGRFDYLETGSLISIRSNVQGIVIPSEEEEIRMYPLDFEEFAWAMEKSQLIEYIKECYVKGEALDDALHREAMLLFRQYIIVGGMPQSVSAYISTPIRSFNNTESAKKNILNLYRQDIMKIDEGYRSKVASIFKKMPSFLSKHGRRVVYSDIEKGSSYESYRKTFFWLSQSMMANIVFNTREHEVGLALNEDRTYVKCYMGDTGLLIRHAFSDNEKIDSNLYRELYLGRLSVNEGMFFENAIAQCLVASGHKLFFYTHYDKEAKRNDMEIDFLISKGGKIRSKIYPIEVKSGDQYSLNSLKKFMAKYHQRIGTAYVIHTKNYSEKEGITYLPCYMAFLI